LLIREAIVQGSADLKFAGIESPRLDSSLLLAHVLKTTRTALVAADTDTLSEKACAEFCELIERRCSGECVAYITGKKEFRGLEFEVNPFVLVPRPDTEILVEAALEIGAEDQGRVLELCTGSGAIAVALKYELPKLEIHATDICPNALAVATQNAARLLPHGKIQFYQGDLYNAIPTQSFDSSQLYSLIISNPPYIQSHKIEKLPAEVQKEPRIALDGGFSGLDIIERIIEQAPDHLVNGGTLLLEADSEQMDNIKSLLEQKGFFSIKSFNDLSGLERVIGGKFEK